MPFSFDKAAIKNSSFKLKSIWFVILMSIIFYSCHKSNDAPIANSVDAKIQLVQKLEQEFNRKAYTKSDLNLEQVLKFNTKLMWEIQWASEGIVPDTVNGVIYAYIPIKPHIKSGQKRLPVKNINYSRYLLASIKDGIVGFSSAYVDANINTIKFTGLVTIKSLDRRVGGLYAYNSGKIQTNTLDQLKAKAANQKQKVDGLNVNRDCDLYDCTWAWDCVDWYEGSYDGGVQHSPQLGGCSIPPTGPPTGNPLTLCPSVNGWILANETIAGSFCDPSQPPPPPPPVDPTQGGGTNDPSAPPEGFRPLCKSSIILTPSSSNTSEINMTNVYFGITDLPHFPLYKTEVNVIMFNIYINIPNKITDPTDRNKNVTISPEMQKEFIYQAYHFASEQVNLAHGEDFFSAGAQPKYSTLFVMNMISYLNSIALHGMFPAYENANSGLVPSLGASGSNNVTFGKATPANYTTAPSGEGC